MELTLSIYKKINGSKIILPIGEYYKDVLVVSKQYVVIHSNPIYIMGMEKMKDFDYIPALGKISEKKWIRKADLYECEEFDGLSLNGKFLDKLFNELYRQWVNGIDGVSNDVNSGEKVSENLTEKVNPPPPSSTYKLFTTISFITISKKKKGKYSIYCKTNSTDKPSLSIKFDDNKILGFLRVIGVDEGLETTLHTQLEHVENISEICMKLYEIMEGNNTSTSSVPEDVMKWFSTIFLPTHKYIPKKDNTLSFIKFLLNR